MEIELKQQCGNMFDSGPYASGMLPNNRQNERYKRIIGHLGMLGVEVITSCRR